MIAQVAAAGAAFVCMEPVTAVVHRWVMHGPGWVLHQSHHQSRPGVRRLEANDAYPVIFAGSTVAVMALGSRVPALRLLLGVGVGVTAYGAAYAFVHDVMIHRRVLPRLAASGRLSGLRDAHGVHHRFGGAPYGMLWPVVPAERRVATS